MPIQPGSQLSTDEVLIVTDDDSNEDDLPRVHLTVGQSAESGSELQSTSANSVPGVSSSAACTPMPGTSYESEETKDTLCPLDRLLTMFKATHSVKQIISIFRASGDDFDASVECLVSGPTLACILKMMNNRFAHEAVVKVRVDSEEAWQDTVTYYKSHRVDVTKQLRVQLDDQPALDTGGVRAQLYSSVYEGFITNQHVKLFDGPNCYKRPRCTAEARSSGLFKVLGTMVAHSIAQVGIGFPYFSPLCYWYIVDGEERSLE